MIVEMTEQAAKTFASPGSWLKDLAKLLLAIGVLVSMVLVFFWALLMLGSYGQNWYALLYPMGAILYGFASMSFIYWLDNRFSE